MKYSTPYYYLRYLPYYYLIFKAGTQNLEEMVLPLPSHFLFKGLGSLLGSLAYWLHPPNNNRSRVVKSYLLEAGVEWLNPSPSYTPLPIKGECISAISISPPIVWVEYHEH